jgi:hypothetical protein
MGGAFPEWALEAFSGYAAVDELYEGPYCVLSAVEIDSTNGCCMKSWITIRTITISKHIEAFLGRLKTALARVGPQRFTWIGETFKKIFSPNLENTLTFLDDKLLPATSNAVERGNRRHRKMQKSVYRRSRACLEGRIALDMIRESRGEGRDQTTRVLHQARRGYT